MKPPPTPEDETARLAALHELEILDTLPEAGYDDITQIAAQICSTPIALVSLVDQDRQWYKAKFGVDIDETPRDLAFCAHAIVEPQRLMIVEDVGRDPRFADNPLVTAAGIGFYAGAPLVTADGHALGTLCVIDREPRTLTDAQLESLEALARQVIALMELRRNVARLEHSQQALEVANAELARRNTLVERSRDELASLCSLLEDQAAIMERDLNRAETIQRSLLPHEIGQLKGVSLHTLYRPGRNIGGDLFDAVVVDDRYLVLVIADAAGHGVSAAMISLLFKNRLRMADDSGRLFRPCEALTRLNQAMQHDKPAPGVFVTAAYGLLDMEERKLVIASAGHPPLIRLGPDGAAEFVKPTGPALGLYADAEFGEAHLTLTDGDRVLLYTDGLFNTAAEGETPTPESVADVLRVLPLEGTTLRRLLRGVTGGVDVEDRDDVSMMLLQAGAGENYLDEPAELLPSGTVAEPPAPLIRYAETDEATFLILEGRVTWLCGKTLLDSALSVLDAGRPLIVDLGGCEYLDSTILGTLHELVEWAARNRGTITLQRVAEPLVEAFQELSMSVVLERIATEALPVPDVTNEVQVPEQTRRAHHRRLLKAHEVLSALSDENREQFASVLDAMRDPD